MDKKTILVTGGLGFIGCHTIKALKDKEFNIITVDNHSAGQDNLPFVKSFLTKEDTEVDGNITETIYNEYNLKLFEEADYIIHLGAKIDVAESMEKPALYLENNVWATLELLEEAKNNNIKKVVIASSCSVNNPKSFYAWSKQSCEQMAEFYTEQFGLEVVCLRYYNVYGTRQLSDNAVIPSFIKKSINNENPEIHGGGKQVRDFIHVEDVADANIGALNAKPGVYHIGTGNKVSIRGLWAIIKALTKTSAKSIISDKRKGDIDVSVCPHKELMKTQKALNWKPKYPTLNISKLEEIIKYYRSKNE